MRLEHFVDKKYIHFNKPKLKSNIVYGLDSCIAWFNSKKNTNTTTDGDFVNSWKSIISNHEFTASSDAASPLYIASDGNFNGNPSINISAFTRFMRVNVSLSGVIVVVVRKASISNFSKMLYSNTATNTDQGEFVSLGGNSATNGYNQGFGYYRGDLAASANEALLVSGTNYANAMIGVISYDHIVVNGLLMQKIENKITQQYSIDWLGRNISARSCLFQTAEILFYQRYITVDESIDLCHKIDTENNYGIL
jgi:hypothetical protein